MLRNSCRNGGGDGLTLLFLQEDGYGENKPNTRVDRGIGKGQAG
jgi:hypothetical protein